MTSEVHSLADHQQIPRAERIARLNDALRKSGQGGVIVVTRGVRALPGFDAEALLTMLLVTNGFDSDNDPYGERDFGDLEWNDGTDLLWKIDYYCSRDMTFASPDPADPAVTQRVLTVMLASEY